MVVLRTLRPRDELGWRVPRPGTIAADIYALARASRLSASIQQKRANVATNSALFTNIAQ